MKQDKTTQDNSSANRDIVEQKSVDTVSESTPSTSNVVTLQSIVGMKNVKQMIDSRTLPRKTRTPSSLIQRNSPSEEIQAEHEGLEVEEGSEGKEITGENPSGEQPPAEGGGADGEGGEDSAGGADDGEGGKGGADAQSELEGDVEAKVSDKDKLDQDTSQTDHDTQDKSKSDKGEPKSFAASSGEEAVADKAEGSQEGEQSPEEKAAAKDTPSPTSDVQTGKQELDTPKPEDTGIDSETTKGELKQENPEAAVKADAPDTKKEEGDKKSEDKGADETKAQGDELQTAAEEGTGGGSPLVSLLGERRQSAGQATAEAESKKTVIKEATNLAQSTAASPPEFAPDETGDTDAEAQRAIANVAIADFMTSASDRINSLQGVTETASAEVEVAMEAGIDQIMSDMTSRQQDIVAKIEQTKAQAQAKAASAKSQVTNTSQATIASIETATAESRLQIEAQFQTVMMDLLAKEMQQNMDIDAIYSKADADFRAIGVTVGDVAMEEGEKKALDYEGGKINRKDSFMDGYLTDRRAKARMKAAGEVSKQYKQGLIDAANEQADNAQKGKPKDLETVTTVANDSRTTLESQLEEALANLDSQTTSAIEQVTSNTNSILDSIDSSLQATLTALDAQKETQSTVLSESAEIHQQSIVEGAESAIANINEGVATSITSLHEALNAIHAQVAGAPIPDSEMLQKQLSVAKTGLDGGIDAAITQFEEVGSSSASSISTSASSSLTALGEMHAGAIEEADNTGATFNQSMTDITNSARQSFAQLEKSHTTTLKQMTGSTLKGFEEVNKGIEQSFKIMGDNLKKSFEIGAQKLDAGLRKPITEKMMPKIEEEAKAAAAKEQPAWKGILKIVLIIAVIVVVALVVGPAVIGAVGAMAGALGASAGAAGVIGTVVGGAIVGAGAGAVTQMGNNLIDGKDLLDGVGQAMLIGAIGGAIGGGAGALGKVVGEAGKFGGPIMQKVSKFGIEMGLDIAGEITTNLVTGQDITFEGLLQSTAIGLGTAGMSKIKAVEGIQTRSGDFGVELGTGAGKQIKSGTPKVDVDAPSKPVDVDTSTPKAPDADTPSTPKAPDADTPSTPKAPDADTPSTPKATDGDAPSTGKRPIDQPEVEPGVIIMGKTADGEHNLKMIKSGEFVRCSSCGKLKDAYADVLAKNPELDTKLKELEIKSAQEGYDPQKLVEEAALLEADLATAKRNDIDLQDAVAPKPDEQMIPLDDVYFTQGTVGAKTSDGKPLTQMASEMQSASDSGQKWDLNSEYDGVDVISFPDGRIVTVDHRRLVAARMAGLPEVPAKLHSPEEVLPPDSQNRFRLQADPNPDIERLIGRSLDGPDGRLARTWREAAIFRAANNKVFNVNDFPLIGSQATPTIRQPKPSGRRGGNRR